MAPVMLHALLDRHRIANGADQQGPPPEDGPGAFASPDGLAALSRMSYGG
jgi:hypothetical protein